VRQTAARVLCRRFDTTAITTLRLVYIVVAGNFSALRDDNLNGGNDSVSAHVIHPVIFTHVVGILVAFAVNRFSHVGNRDYISKTTTYALMDEAQYEPDIIFCMANATLSNPPYDLDYRMDRLSDPSVPSGFRVQSPCDTSVHDTMFVFWPRSEVRKIWGIEDLRQAIEFETNSTVWLLCSC